MEYRYIYSLSFNLDHILKDGEPLDEKIREVMVTEAALSLAKLGLGDIHIDVVFYKRKGCTKRKVE